MTLVKIRPRIDHENLNKSVKRMFGEMPEFFGSDSGFFPRVDIIEAEKELKINVELPGLKKEDVKLVVENGVLNISGNREKETESKEKFNILKSEIFHGPFNRSFQLSEEYDSENIKAEFESGILSVAIGKKMVEEPKERVIKIK
ncbi:MAG: Hsp20/alpha crystallin family protein [Ignavibacteriaceae bacterium]|nr:Hsp20/alpha crystallin family protein [Ignavibacteriaceae bacterium]